MVAISWHRIGAEVFQAGRQEHREYGCTAGGAGDPRLGITTCCGGGEVGALHDVELTAGSGATRLGEFYLAD